MVPPSARFTRRLVRDGFQDAGTHLRHFVQAVVDACAAAADCRVSKQRLSTGIFSSERPRASRSRGPAIPMVTLASSRSISSTPPSSLRSSARRIVCCSSFADGIEAAARSRAPSMEGRSSRCRSRRPPMPVSVWSSTASSVALLSRGEDRFHQFQVAHRHGVEHHAIGAVVETRAGPGDRARRAAFREGNAGWRRRPQTAAGRSASPQPSSESRLKCSRRVRSA